MIMAMNESTMTSNSSSPIEFPVAQRLLTIYGGLLIFVGVPLNIITVAVLQKGFGNRITTRSLMILLALGDTAVLLTAVLRYWFRASFGVDIRVFHQFSCKGHAFLVGFFSDFAVGMLCSIAVERFLVVAFPQRSNQIVTNRTMTVGLLCLLGYASLKNLSLFWLFNLEQTSTNGTSLWLCKANSALAANVRAFIKLDFVTYSVMPYIVLFTCNVYIYVRLRNQRKLLNRSRRSTPSVGGVAAGHGDKVQPTKRKPEAVIKMLTALTVLHAITTLPGSIFILLKIYFQLMEKARGNEYEKRRLEVLYEGLMMLVFTNNATNFAAYMASSTPFRQSFYRLFASCQRGKKPAGIGEQKTMEVTFSQRIFKSKKAKSKKPTTLITVDAGKPLLVPQGVQEDNGRYQGSPTSMPLIHIHKNEEDQEAGAPGEANNV